MTRGIIREDRRPGARDTLLICARRTRKKSRINTLICTLAFPHQTLLHISPWSEFWSIFWESEGLHFSETLGQTAGKIEVLDIEAMPTIFLVFARNSLKVRLHLLSF